MTAGVEKDVRAGVGSVMVEMVGRVVDDMVGMRSEVNVGSARRCPRLQGWVR